MKILAITLVILLVTAISAADRLGRGMIRSRRPGPRRHQICPNGKVMYHCYLNPCRFARCPNHPEYKCKPNYCGGCSRTWITPDNETTDC